MTDLGEIPAPHNLPPSMGIIGATSGIKVIEDPRYGLGYDEMYISQYQAAIVVGELAHFRYRVAQINENHKLRARVRAQIQRRAEEILGEPWELSPS
jgi:hypothetical protein